MNIIKISEQKKYKKIKFEQSAGLLLLTKFSITWKNICSVETNLKDF